MQEGHSPFMLSDAISGNLDKPFQRPGCAGRGGSFSHLHLLWRRRADWQQCFLEHIGPPTRAVGTKFRWAWPSTPEIMPAGCRKPNAELARGYLAQNGCGTYEISGEVFARRPQPGIALTAMAMYRGFPWRNREFDLTYVGIRMCYSKSGHSEGDSTRTNFRDEHAWAG